jgi:type II secretory pathway component PulF
VSAFQAALTPGVSAQTLALAFHEMAALLNAGVRLDDALEQTSATGPLHFRSAMESLAHYVRAGHPLSEGMRSYGALFHPVIPAIVRAGETTGNLDFSFRLLSSFFEAEAQLRRTVQSALIYPTMVVVTAIVAVLILSYINFMPNTWAIRLLWLLGGAVGLWLLLRFRTLQRVARYIVMLFPFFGQLMQQLAVARFCLTFGLLVRAGVPYMEGLEATEPVVQHPAVEMAVRHIYAGVRNGVTVEESIRAQHAFPRIVTNLVGAGEMSGNLDESLLKAAEYLRNDAEYKVKNSAKFIGPVMILALGVIVALILVQFLQSYFDLIFSLAEE